MNEREKLEAAAKAAGISLEWDGDPREWQAMYYRGKTYHGWDPENNAEDSQHLANLCGITINTSSATSGAKLITAVAPDGTTACGRNQNTQIAMRLAVFNCAVHLGRSIP